MGTNYYHKTKPCEKCGSRKVEKHIGKSSYGWEFHFRGYLDESIVSFEDWKNEFKDEDKQIVDEYGEVIPLAEFGEIVESKKGGLNNYNVTVGQPQTEKEKKYCAERQNGYGFGRDNKCWKDNEGHTFTDHEFC
jgi:hypothetical protein